MALTINLPSGRKITISVEAAAEKIEEVTGLEVVKDDDETPEETVGNDDTRDLTGLADPASY